MTHADFFNERYLIASYADGGVVIDLETGNYFRVDPAAACVCEVLRDSEGKAPLDEVSVRLGVPWAHAERLVADTRSALDAAPVLGTPTGPYHFYPEPNGYGLWYAGERVLAVTSDLVIHAPPGERGRRNPLLESYVRALAPKIMFIRGLTVLHASACAANGALVAFSGQSGAGKTTTAQAFVRAGARLVSEDLVVLKSGSARPSAVVGAEARVHAWAKRTAEALASGDIAASSDALAGMADGEAQTLDAIFFLNATRRAGSDFAYRTLNGPDALLSLMANDFLGGSSRNEWRRYFAGTKAIAAVLRLIEMDAPLGLEYLNSSAERHISNWASYVDAGTS